jgi:hypothetical protein
MSVVITPTSGSHTYKISLESIDAGTATMIAASDQLCELLIEDVGPA